MSAVEVKFKDLIKLFDTYFIPKGNIAIERHAFFTRKQNGGEDIDDYVQALKNLSLTCEFVKKRRLGEGRVHLWLVSKSKAHQGKISK